MTDRIYLTIDFYKKDAAKAVPGCQWHKDRKQWSFPYMQAPVLGAAFPENAGSITYQADIIRKEMEEAERQLQYELDTLKIDYEFKLQPYEHQMMMIKRGLVNQHFAYLCEMGTGKTKVIVDLYGIRHNLGRVKRCLIVCPKTLIENWGDEVEKNSDFKYTLAFAPIGKNAKEKRAKMVADAENFCIINYEGVMNIATKRVMKDGKMQKVIDPSVFEGYDMVVLDESSKIKNHKAGRTQVIIEVFNRVRYKYILSGTPITQSPVDIYSQYFFLNPDFLGFRSYYSFRNYHCVMGGYGGYEIIQYNHLPELKSKIAKHSIQLKKIDCLELPEKIYEKRTLEMSKEMHEQYEAMKKEMILEYEGGTLTASIVLTKLLRLQQIMSGAVLPDQKGNEKLNELKEILEDNPNDSIIIWCQFRKTIKLIESIINEPYSILYGDITNRKEQIDAFQEKKHRIFIGQIETGGSGINLTSANIVVYYENTFKLDDRVQSEDRCHRPGLKNNVVYIDLLYNKTIDKKIHKAIKTKSNIANYLVDSFTKEEE